MLDLGCIVRQGPKEKCWSDWLSTDICVPVAEIECCNSCGSVHAVLAVHWHKKRLGGEFQCSLSTLLDEPWNQ